MIKQRIHGRVRTDTERLMATEKTKAAGYEKNADGKWEFTRKDGSRDG